MSAEPAFGDGRGAGREEGGEAAVRIGELARRAGIPPATLRAWERRYGIVEPQRTESGYRLYSARDERRLRAMVELITRGLAPAEAARTAIAESEAEAAAEVAASPADGGGGDDGGGTARTRTLPTDMETLREELLARLLGFDEVGAHRAFDRAVAAYGLESLITELVLPVLRRIGDLWSRDEVTVAQEHFASQLIRGRVLALGRGWGGGSGPLLLLACPPGENHDLGLVCFGLMMRERGFRVSLLGADTPLDTIAAAAGRLEPARIVLSVTSADAARGLADLGGNGGLDLGRPVALAGREAGEKLASELGASLLAGEMSDAADRLAATV